MTIQDMHMAVKLELDKSTITGYPNFTEEEIDYFINKAYLAKINQKFAGKNEEDAPFEGSTKRLMDLKDLVVNTTLQGALNQSVVKNEYLFATMQVPQILFPIEDSMVAFHKKHGGTDTRVVTLIEHENVAPFKKTSQNNPWVPNPVMILEHNHIKLYADGEDVETYAPDYVQLHLAYVKRPQRLQYYVYDINGNRVLNTANDSTRIPEVPFVDEIISLTVTFMLDNIESQRVQTQPAINQNIER